MLKTGNNSDTFNGPFDDDIYYLRESRKLKLSNLMNENEVHTLTWLSRSIIASYHKRQRSLSGVSAPGKQKTASTRLQKQVSVFPFSIDVSKNTSQPLRTDGATSTVVEPNVDSVSVQPEFKQHLLTWTKVSYFLIYLSRLLDILLQWQLTESRSIETWKEDRNILLSAFFLGYVIFQIPAARAAEILGAKS